MRSLLALALIACAYGHNETMLLPPKGISAFRLTGAPLGRASEVKVEDQFFTEALRLETTTAPPNLHGEGQRALRIRAAPADAVQKNDTIIATLRHNLQCGKGGGTVHQIGPLLRYGW